MSPDFRSLLLGFLNSGESSYLKVPPALNHWAHRHRLSTLPNEIFIVASRLPEFWRIQLPYPPALNHWAHRHRLSTLPNVKSMNRIAKMAPTLVADVTRLQVVASRLPEFWRIQLPYVPPALNHCIDTV